MKFIKILILLVAVFSIAGMAFFQLCLLLISALFAKQTYHRHNSRHNGLTLMWHQAISIYIHQQVMRQSC